MSSLRIDQINVVVADVEGAARFLVDLGVDIPATRSEWTSHHRSNLPWATSIEVAHHLAEPTFGIDLDSSAFAVQWGGLPSTFTGVVVNVRADDRAE